MSIEVREYLDRLEFGEPGEPDDDLLIRLHERHLLKVPFENLDIHRGVPIRLDEDAILDKIVRARRGGFCYELNTAFAWLLRQLGFSVEMLSAEVRNDAGEWGIPFDHMLLRVDGDHIADVGFGDSFRHPLALAERGEVVQFWEKFQLEEDGERIVLRRYVREALGFVPQYRFTLEPRDLADFTAGCDYHQSSPQSPFTRRRMCSIALPDGRVTLTDDALKVTRYRGRTTETPVAPERWEDELRRHFSVAF